VRGANSDIVVENKNIQVINFAFGAELKTLILNAETIICRSGYSTLMDLNFLNKEKLILVPTPGQTEQKYLAQYWKEKFNAKVYLQDQLTQIT
jgi:predicted glycosyltransferase